MSAAALHLGMDEFTRRRVVPRRTPLAVWCARCGRDGHTERSCNLTVGAPELPLETPGGNGVYQGDPAKIRHLAPGVTGEDLTDEELRAAGKYHVPRWKSIAVVHEPPVGCTTIARAAVMLDYSVFWVRVLCRQGKLGAEFMHGTYWPRLEAVKAFRRRCRRKTIA